MLLLVEKSFFLPPLEAPSMLVSEPAVAIPGKPSRGFLTLLLVEFLLLGVVGLGRLILEDEIRLLLFFSPKDLRRLS